MSADKLVDSTQLDADLTSVANAIRTKGGTSASLTFPSDFVSAINAISGGGGMTVTDVPNSNGTGSVISGEASVLGTKTITANGTYLASDDDADGYSSVTVNVPSSAASSWTKVAETSYQVSTTNTAAQPVATWKTGSSDLWTSSKWVYVRIRDTAGKREGYFYGCDQFFCNKEPINGTSSTYTDAAMNLYIRYSASGFGAGINTIVSFYGVYADRLYSNGDLRIRSRYHSSNTLTIDGTYKVEVYLLDPAGGVPIFE